MQLGCITVIQITYPAKQPNFARAENPGGVLQLRGKWRHHVWFGPVLSPIRL